MLCPDITRGANKLYKFIEFIYRFVDVLDQQSGTQYNTMTLQLKWIWIGYDCWRIMFIIMYSGDGFFLNWKYEELNKLSYRIELVDTG